MLAKGEAIDGAGRKALGVKAGAGGTKTELRDEDGAESGSATLAGAVLTEVRQHGFAEQARLGFAVVAPDLEHDVGLPH